MAVFTSEHKQLSRQLIQTTTGFSVSVSLHSITLYTSPILVLMSFYAAWRGELQALLPVRQVQFQVPPLP